MYEKILLLIFILSIAWIIYGVIDQTNNPQDYYYPDYYEDSSWCSGVYCD